MRPSFSIITIVFNDVENILKTINSVISQTYKNIEYILIDGQSTDGTKEKILEILQSLGEITLLEENPSRLYLKGTLKQYPTFSFQFLSEQDQGIYDAMNKGIALANKDWINFMNCGDRFYTSEVLESLSRENLLNFDVIYGDTEIYFSKQNLHIKRTSHQDLRQLYKLFSGFNHQSFFIRTSLHQANPYNLKYHLAADYDLIYKLSQQHCNFKHIPLTIATFFSGGESDLQSSKSLKEALQVSLKYTKCKIKVYLFYLFAILKKYIKNHSSSAILMMILKFYPNRQNKQ